MKTVGSIIEAMQSSKLSFGRYIRWLILGCIIFGIICGPIFACVWRISEGKQQAQRVKLAVQETLPYHCSQHNDLIVYPAGWLLGLAFPFPARNWSGMCNGVTDSYFSVNLSTCEVTTIHFGGNNTHKLAWCPE